MAVAPMPGGYTAIGGDAMTVDKMVPRDRAAYGDFML